MKLLDNFIVLEGLDGSGTTTQGELLASQFKGSVFTCEPSTGTIGRLIRRYLSGEKDIDKRTLTHLFVADRSDHIYGTNGIVDLAQKNYVFCDRYILSTFAYQSLDVEKDLIIKLNEDFPVPKLTIFIDVEIKTALERIYKREEREIYEKEELLNKIRSNYYEAIDLFKKKGWRIEILDGSKSIEELNKQIKDLIPNLTYGGGG